MAAVLNLADFRISFAGRYLERFIRVMPSFAPFLDNSASAASDDCLGTDFRIVPDLSIPHLPEESFFDVSFEGIECRFYRSGEDVLFRMQDGTSGMTLYEKWTVGDRTVHITDDAYTPSMYRYALWTAVNFLVCGSSCLAVHCSANVFPSELSGASAVVCLGESGTGKSTHTRLMRERFSSSFLLNDDSPFIKVMPDGKVAVYGSPWSGKTPCYKAESYPLAAVIRLSQAPFNSISRLDSIRSIAALLPSMPPVLTQIEECSDAVCDFVSSVVEAVPVFHLECLPDLNAAALSVSTVFGSSAKKF